MAFLLPLDLSNCSSKSSIHSWNWDFLTSTSVKLCLKLLSCEPPITQVLTFRNFSSDRFVALGLPDLFLSVSSSFQVPFDGVGNCTHWHLGLLCNFSKGKTYTFKGYNGLSVFLCQLSFSRHYDSNKLLPAAQYCPNNASEGVATQSVPTLLLYRQRVCNSSTKVWTPVGIVCINFQGLIYFHCCRTAAVANPLLVPWKGPFLTTLKFTLFFSFW